MAALAGKLEVPRIVAVKGDIQFFEEQILDQLWSAVDKMIHRLWAGGIGGGFEDVLAQGPRAAVGLVDDPPLRPIAVGRRVVASGGQEDAR